MFDLSNISGLLTAVVVLGVLIFVHELGHFLVAKRLGFCVLKFSIGFGKKLFGVVKGETEYLISAIPLGGYVKFYGENTMGEEEDVATLSDEEKLRASDVPEHREFSNIHPFKRLLTIIAGPIFNLIFASFLFTIILLNGFVVPGTKIGEALEDRPAYKAGVREGDKILEIDGNEVKDWEDVHHFITTGSDPLVKLKIDRAGEVIDFSIEPEIKMSEGAPGAKEVQRRLVGIVNSQDPEDAIEKTFGFGEAIVVGAEQTVGYIMMTLKGVKMMIFREISVRENLGGPIMIVQMTGKFAQKGILYLLNFMAIISISLGVINLFPIPILDGGAVVFTLIEMIKGSPVTLKVRMAAQQVGMVLLIALMLFAFYNDIARLMAPPS